MEVKDGEGTRLTETFEIEDINSEEMQRAECSTAAVKRNRIIL